MARSVRRPGGERGIALVLTLMVLLTLSALALAFLASSALEPQISRNLHDASRARWLAEAGFELGYGLLAAAGDTTSSGLVASADASWVALPSLDQAALPGLTPAEGSYSVSIRRDPQAADGLILRSTGTFNTTTRTVEVALRRVLVGSPPAPAPRVLHAISGWREL